MLTTHSNLEYLEINDDKSKLDRTLIHRFLSEQSSWAKDISFARVALSIDNSLCVGAYIHSTQVGFCRVVSDFATFAYLCDVFVVEAYRSQGISKAMLKYLFGLSQLDNIRRTMLVTADAQGLYRQFGFTALDKPERTMQKHQADLYANIKTSETLC